MREYLFRGKRVVNGEWVYGDLLQNIDAVKIREREENLRSIAKSFVVVPETVGMWTGKTDFYGTKIFEGDILGEQAFTPSNEPCFNVVGVVRFNEEEGRFVLTDENGYYNDWTLEEEAQPEEWRRWEIGGNIYDDKNEKGGDTNPQKSV